MIGPSTHRKPVLLALAASFLLTVLIIAGSRNLEHYDSALFGYTIASVVAFGAIVFRYAVWLQRPATRVYWRRGWKLYLQREKFLQNTASAAKTLATNLYWINMGAVAITTLAGARLIIAAPEWPVLHDFMPFLKGSTLFFWAAGTWWIPLLFILGFWRHVYKRFPLKYDPQYWGMVFPFGIYTVCTIQLSRAINFPPLLVIPRYFIYLALAGWVVVFVGLLYSLFFRNRA